MFLINRRLRTGEPIPDRLPASITPQAVAFDLEPKAPSPPSLTPSTSSSQLTDSGGMKLAAPPAGKSASRAAATRTAALERLATGADRERQPSLGSLQAPQSPVSAYSTPPATPPATLPTSTGARSSGYGSPSPTGLASPSAYFGNDDFAKEEKLRTEIDAKQARADALRGQVSQGEMTNQLGVKRLEELSQKSVELDKILAEMQQQLADQETAKGDILKEYQVRSWCFFFFFFSPSPARDGR